ncbi:4'-phosphopantetheinyl transferase family protein [Streptomyces prasinopilosus]|uniref:4'-phosphopantetheinyl transferase n=1 Tax=Streptomyces prasinopilosus TaxID=67344 RepID=A0A1G6M4B7_9ACTN|nr:4'-phosphopantetheinyl transferase superfamily protein [Streptomyces prasinopilosus]SDC50164.1 4'-phosphopantetheinyl transferase [Streptomyces prasinopilosus]
MDISPDHVHVWWIGLDDHDAHRLADLYRDLGLFERRRHADLSRRLFRNRFTVAHAALRRILARYLDAEPSDLRLSENRWGKPALDMGVPAPQFSLSHVEGTAVLVVTRSRAVGVDIERRRADAFTSAVAVRHFPSDEARLLARLTPTRRGAVFLRLWTRKEASVKAVGGRLADGLALPVASGGRTLLVPCPSGGGGLLRARDLRAPRHHAAAVALTGAAPFRVVHRYWQL